MKRCIFFLITLIATVIYCKAQTQETMADNSFGVKGDVIITDANRSPDTGFYIGARMALQGKKVIVAGAVSSVYNQTKFPDKIKLFRLNSDGSLDSSFGDKGVFTYTFPERWDEGFYRVRCQSTGKIVCAIYAYNNRVFNYRSFYGLIRINANGTLDTAFGDSGFYKTTIETRDMVILPNDEIVVVSKRAIQNKLGYKIIKYGKDGGMLASDSIQFTAPNYISFASQIRMRVTDDNKIVLGGDQYYRGPNNLGFCVYSYDFSLKRNLSYGKNGEFIYAVSTRNTRTSGFRFVGMTTQSNGKVVGAYISNDTLKMIGVDNTGKLNKEFGINGINDYRFRIKLNYVDSYTGLETQSDDKLLFSPLLNARGIYLTRFKADGYIDPSFGDSGASFKHVFIRGHQVRTTPFEILIQPDDKALVCSDGEFREFNDSDFEGAGIISRYLSGKIADETIAKAAILSSVKPTTESISISPNPVKDVLNIFSSNLSYKNISVINTSGVTVLKDAFAGKQHSVNTSALSSGIYYIRVTDRDGNMQSVKLIKQ